MNRDNFIDILNDNIKGWDPSSAISLIEDFFEDTDVSELERQKLRSIMGQILPKILEQTIEHYMYTYNVVTLIGVKGNIIKYIK